jgi:hypothetical protein
MSVKGHSALGPKPTQTAFYDDEEHVPVPTDAALPGKLGVVERRVHARINGHRTVGEIARQIGLSVTEVAAILARLREVGALVGSTSTGEQEAVDISIVLDDELDEPRR